MTILAQQQTVADFDAFLAQPENQDRLFELINDEERHDDATA
jgi:hypothetical protein